MGPLPPPGPPPALAALTAAALLLAVPPSAGSQAPPFVIRQTPVAALAGGAVNFTPDPPVAGVLFCSWHRAPEPDVTLEILSFFPGGPGQQDGPAQSGRERGGPDCSLRVAPLLAADAGPFTLLVRHPGATTATVTLLVHELLAEPSVTPAEVTVTENDTLALSCHPPNGTAVLAWLRDGDMVTAGGRLSLSPDNQTLTVRPAQRGDAGAYACHVTNAVSANCSRDVNVTVLYGPDTVTVTPPGPLPLRPGSPLELLCAADAVPSPSFSWARDNASLAIAGPLLTLGGSEEPLVAGHYRCRATNPALGLAAEATVVLLPPQDWSLGAGAVAGIVLGTSLGLALLVAAGYVLWRRGGRSPAPPPLDGAKPSAPPCETPVADGADKGEEIKYLTLTFGALGGPEPRGPPQPRDGGTVYSEVRRK